VYPYSFLLGVTRWGTTPLELTTILALESCPGAFTIPFFACRIALAFFSISSILLIDR
jgi:hypothetical protein